jgi:hypothetical protein
MSLSKTSVQPVDLDDLERQLREVAVSSAPKKNEDPLSELARIVGREKPLRSIVGGRAEAAQAVPQPAVANDTAPTQPRFVQAEAAGPAEPWADETEDAVEDDEPQFAQDEDELATEDASVAYSEEWEDQPAEEDAVYAEENTISRYDAVEPVPGIEGEAAVEKRRGLVSPRMLAFTIPVALALVGVGAAVAMRGSPVLGQRGDAPVIKADESPVKVQPAKVADRDQTPSQTALDAADPLSKPSQVVLARPEQPVDVVAAVKGAQPRGGAAPVQPPPSSGIVIVAGPGASAGSGSAAPASPAAPAMAPAALPMPTAAANVPLPDPPQPSAQGSVFGTPRRVSTVSVKPDGTIVSGAKPRIDSMPQPKRLASADPTAAPAPDSSVVATPPSAPAAPAPAAAAPSPAAPAAAAPSAAPATPAARKPADNVRARPTPAVSANGDADAKPARPAAKPPKPKLADLTPASATTHNADAGADRSAPLSITPQGRHGRQVASAAETTPRAAATEAPTNAARGESGFSVQLASSPSESDARATLSRLQRQFPSLGGGSVRRADLGAKGIYYRVRVGPLTRDAADKICTQLKAGGAECILTRG